MTLPNLQSVTDMIDNIKVDNADIVNQEISDDIVEWYMFRFNLFLQDGCPLAVNSYLEHLMNNKKCNTLTRSCIISKLYSIQEEYERKRCKDE